MQIRGKYCLQHSIKTCQTAWQEEENDLVSMCFLLGSSGYLFCIFYSWAEVWNVLIRTVSSPLSAGLSWLLLSSMCDVMRSNRRYESLIKVGGCLNYNCCWSIDPSDEFVYKVLKHLLDLDLFNWPQCKKLVFCTDTFITYSYQFS